jgi:phosphatidylglycerophosphate synthase
VPNLLSLARLALVPVLWVLAVDGDARAVGMGLALAFASDVLDGRIARRRGQVSSIGSALDSLADNVLQPSAAAWLYMLRTGFVRAHAPIIILAVVIYLTSLSVGLLRFRRLGNLHLHSSRAAAVVEYLFIVQALVSASPSALLLYLASAIWMVSSTETLLLQLTRGSVNEHMGTIVSRRRSA